jgi:hypothetical protein
VPSQAVRLAPAGAASSPSYELHTTRLKAVRVCDSGIENFEMLCADEGFELTLLRPHPTTVAATTAQIQPDWHGSSSSPVGVVLLKSPNAPIKLGGLKGPHIRFH